VGFRTFLVIMDGLANACECVIRSSTVTVESVKVSESVTCEHSGEYCRFSIVIINAK
jgi:hypothetical protein